MTAAAVRTRVAGIVAGGIAVVLAAVVASVLVVSRPTPLPHDGSIADPGTPNPLTDRMSIHLHDPGRVVPASEVSGDVSMPWLLFDVKDGGRTVQIVAATGDGSCVKPDGYRVVETRSYVELWVLSRHGAPGAHCVDLVDEWRANIPLAKPLGSRVLLHPSTDPDWTPERAFDTGYVYATP